MEKNRLEAFSDGVIAIIITVMVLEMKVPHGDDLATLATLWPVFLSYVLSFIYVGIYWNNHHHTLQAATSINSGCLWANLHLLFWLSLLPFTSGWMGENHFSRMPTVTYGLNLLACALAYTVFLGQLVRHHGAHSALAESVGRDVKGRASILLYVLGIASAWWLTPVLGMAFFTAVSLIWLVPDRRMEKVALHRANIEP